MEQYVNGRWYDGGIHNKDGGRETRQRVKRHQGIPYVVNNNFMIGNAAKISRAKRWGHWFLEEDGTCGDRITREKQLAAATRSFETLEPSSLPSLDERVDTQ